MFRLLLGYVSMETRFSPSWASIQIILSLQAVEMGAAKATLPPMKCFIMAVMGGIFIAFGGALAVSVGPNCPELAASNPGLVKILSGKSPLSLPMSWHLFSNKGVYFQTPASIFTQGASNLLTRSKMSCLLPLIPHCLYMSPTPQLLWFVSLCISKLQATLLCCTGLGHPALTLLY